MKWKLQQIKCLEHGMLDEVSLNIHETEGWFPYRNHCFQKGILLLSLFPACRSLKVIDDGIPAGKAENKSGVFHLWDIDGK